MSDLQTLFALDPLGMSDQDFRSIIEKFRTSRHQFDLGNKMAGSTKPKTEKQKQTEAVAAKLDFNLEL